MIFIWLLFFSTQPFVFVQAILYYSDKIFIAIGMFIIGLLLLFKRKISLGNENIILILCVQIIGFLLLAIFHQFKLGFEFGYIGRILENITILFLYIYIINFFSIDKLSETYINIMIILGLLGFIIFIFGLFGIISPVSFFENPDGRTASNFILTFSNAVYQIRDFLIIRIASFFDEPGTFAFYLTFALLLNKIRNFSVKKEFFLIFFGLFTLSLAYYITIFLYIILFYIRDFKKIFILTFITIIFITLIFVGSNYNPQLNAIRERTIGRLEPTNSDSKRLFKGDNRSDLMLRAFEAFIEAPLIGQGPNYRDNPQNKYYNVFLGANLFSPLAIHGIIGTIIIFLLFFYWTFLVFFKKRKSNWILISSWIIIFINFFQRPTVRGGFLGYFVFIFLVHETINCYKYKRIGGHYNEKRV